MYTLVAAIAYLILLKSASAGNCTTPSGSDGDCISIHSCPRLIQALTTLEESQFKAVKKYQCGFDKPPRVCCPTNSSHKNATTKKVVKDLLPSKAYCGFQHTDDYYVNKHRADPNIDEFPWLGSVYYIDRTSNDRVTFCSCTLINDRYCLAAAHCVVNVRENKIDSVQLGDYNLSEGKDCVQNEGLEDCSDPVMEYDIEEVQVHPEYTFSPVANDIALLRLNQSVTYSDFIRPICLPIEGTSKPKIGDIIYATGWGPGTVLGQTVQIKRRVQTELLKNEICTDLFSRSKQVRMTEHLSCTSGKEKDDCQGHSGGPLMFSKKNQWYLESINALGSACGTSSPSINTNIRGYISWIVENLKE